MAEKMDNSIEVSPLHLAVLKDDLDSLRSLVINSYHNSLKNYLGFTALELAEYLGKEEAIKILSPDSKQNIGIIKPGELKAVNFTPEIFTNHFHVKYRNHLNFQNYDFFKEMRSNCPWTLHTSYLGEENRALAEKFQDELASGAIHNATIRWIDKELGYGLFARRDLPHGTFIGEFTGVVRRLYRFNRNQNEYCFHYPTKFWSWNYTIIDALNEGNETRFINHSDTPNLNPICLCERKLLHIVFITNTFVKAGTQLTYNYGKDFWKNREKKIED